MNKNIKKIEKQKYQGYTEAYSNKMLIDCQKGKPCSYGICDECPNTLGNRKDNEND